MGKVTDPALLAALDAAPASPGKVSDPALLAQLEGDNQSRETTLDRVWSQKSAPPLSAMDTASAAVQRAGRGLLPGWNRIQSAIDAALPYTAAVRPQGDTLGERYESAKANNDRLVGQFDREHPWASPAIGLAGSVPTMIATAGLSSPAALATPVGRIAEGARMGAGLGGLYAAGESKNQSIPQLLGDTATGAAWGGVTGAAIPVAMEIPGAVGRGVSRLLRVKETPQAALLRSEGIPLTTGQRVGPTSILDQMESASRDSWGGAGAERKAAEQAFMRVVQNKGLAPGAKPPASTDLQARSGEILKGFDPVYAQVRDVPISPEVMAALPDTAKMPNRGYDARTANAVSSEIKNALSILGPAPEAPAPSGLLDAKGVPIPAPPAPPQAATAGDLINVRSYLRSEIDSARTSQDFPRLRLLRKAEEVLSDGIEGALPPDKATLLQNADKQYARFMTSLEAAPAGKTEFTPHQYLKRVEKSAGRRSFKTGGAGDLQDLGEAARDSFVEAPPTGFTGTILKSIPYGHKLAAPVSTWLNTPTAQRVLFSPGTAAPTSRAIPPQVAAMLEGLRRREAALALSQAAADQDSAK